MKEVKSISIIRSNNEALIFKSMLYSEGIAISEIADSAHLSLPTVTRAINRALALGWVVPTALVGKERGRKAQKYAFNPRYADFLCIFFRCERGYVRVYNSFFNTLYSEDFELTGGNIYDAITEKCDGILKRFDNLKGIIVTLPAHIRDGYVYSSASFQELNGINLEKQLSDKYGIYVCAMDFVKSLPFTSWDLVEDFDRRNILFLSVNDYDGCASAISLRGKTYPGPTGAFGEPYFLPPRDVTPKNELYRQFALTMIGVINPEIIVFYGDRDSFSSAIESTRKIMPEYMIPRVIYREDLQEDVLRAMRTLFFNHILDLL